MSLVSQFIQQQGQDSPSAQQTTSLLSRVRNSYQPPERQKGGLERFADAVSAPFEAVSDFLFKPVVETMAKPFGELTAGVQELRGKEVPTWAQQNRLSSPEMLAADRMANDKGIMAVLGNRDVQNQASQLAETLRSQGYEGANFTDVLNVLTLLPGGMIAKSGAGAVAGVASGSQRFLPTAATAIKQTAPLATGIGAAYGLAGSVDERASATDTAFNTLIGGALGLGLGAGLGVAGAGLGVVANRIANVANKDLAKKAIIQKNTDAIDSIISKNKTVRRAFTAAERRGMDVKQVLASNDILVGAVDSDGTIRTTRPGGPVEKVRSIVDPVEDTVTSHIIREGRSVSPDELEAVLMANIDSSDIRGRAEIVARQNAAAEVRGLLLRANPDGTIPMTEIQKLKILRGQATNYIDSDVQKIDKTITAGLREFIENNVDGIDVAAINKELSEYYTLLDILEVLDGKVIKGGRLGKYFSQTVGAIVGGQFGGPFGAAVGAEAGGAIRGAQLKSVLSRRTGNMPELSDDILRASQEGKTPRPLVPESRRLPAPDATKSGPAIPMRGPTEYEPQATIIGSTNSNKGLTLDDLNQSNQRGSLTMSHITATKNSNVAISDSISPKSKVDVNNVESLNKEITRRIELFRKEAGFMANREGAGVRLRNVEDGAGNINFVTKDFSLSRAKGQMKYQAESGKRYANVTLYENDPEFRSLVDIRDSLMESRIIDAKTVDEVDELLRLADTEEKTIINEVKQYESSPLSETSGPPPKDKGNGTGQEKGATQGVASLTTDIQKAKASGQSFEEFFEIARHEMAIEKFDENTRDLLGLRQELHTAMESASQSLTDYAKSKRGAMGLVDDVTIKSAEYQKLRTDFDLKKDAVARFMQMNRNNKPFQKAMKEYSRNKMMVSKSQLKAAWDKASADTLLSEAKKYKTAEEFASSQQKLFHGTKEEFEKFDISKSGDVQPSDWGEGAYFTDNKEHARNFAKVAGGDVVLERYAPNVKFANGSELLKDSDFMLALDDDMGFTSPAEYLQEKGFGGVKFKNPKGFTEYVVFDTDQIKTKSQLLDVYKKAHGK